MATPRPASMSMLSRFWMSQPAAVSRRSMLARARSSGRPPAGMGMGGWKRTSQDSAAWRRWGCPDWKEHRRQDRRRYTEDLMANQTIGLVVDAVGTTGVLHQV